MTAYDIATKVAQRFLYGYLHHSELSNFFGLMGYQLWENSQDKNAFGDAKKRKEMDNFIVENYKKYPNYPVPNSTSVAAEFKTATHDAIKSNEKKWLKLGFDELIKYEKETIQLFEQLLKQPIEPKDEKLTQKIKQYCEDVKKELQKIESVNSQLQQADYDFDKFVKEYNKGDSNMPRYDEQNERRRSENEMRRRRMEDERRQIDMELRRMDDEERQYPSMGFTDRIFPFNPFPYNPYTPYFDHTQPMQPNQPMYPNQPQPNYPNPMQPMYPNYESDEQRRQRENMEAEMRRRNR